MGVELVNVRQTDPVTVPCQTNAAGLVGGVRHAEYAGHAVVTDPCELCIQLQLQLQ